MSSADEHDADVIITAVRMKKRLERHVDWDVATTKPVVTPNWLQACATTNTFLPYDAYFAVADLRNAPPTTHVIENANQWFLNPLHPVLVLEIFALECPNQKLVAELAIIRRSRELEGQEINALAYERAIGVPYPHPITTDSLASDVVKLPHIGEKMLSKIIEFVEDGEIAESRTTATSQRFQSLSLFSSIYGIGPKTAQDLYARGIRTLNELERYYDVYADDAETGNGRTDHIGDIPLLGIPAGIRLLAELEQQIPREEVEEMHAVVMRELEGLRPWCVSTITGGYRRGKTRSNDVDIVISHPALESGADYINELCVKLVARLYQQDLSGFHKPGELRTANTDSMQKALTVFKLPDDNSKERIHRRVDLIFAAREVYWTAVTGWTGSKMFERDLRNWAKDHGLKFDSSGITRRRDSKLFFPRTEKEVFDLLGLPWIDPTLRNADS
ncbi:Nucleotidyltransferase [Hymenopellis radicata]|nr:Nucleotidyltransferase [Hymenopellis radicata]